MKKNIIKYTCINCKYFNACGDEERTEPCKGKIPAIIKYKHHAEPETIKELNLEAVYRNNSFAYRGMSYEEFVKLELTKIQKDLENGVLLWYEA